MDTKQNLIELVNLILNPSKNGADVDDLVETFVNSISHPGQSDLIFYPTNWGLPNTPTPSEIVDAALSWNPQIIAMIVTFKRPISGENRLFAYGVRARQCETQIISSDEYAINEVVAVALSGVILPNGHLVTHRYLNRAFTAGEILGQTRNKEGSLVSPSSYDLSRFPTSVRTS